MSFRSREESRPAARLLEEHHQIADLLEHRAVHVRRAELFVEKDGKLVFETDDGGRQFADVHAAEDRNYIYFGDGSGSAGGVTEWKFIRWTNKQSITLGSQPTAFWDLQNSDFEFVSDFGFRILNLRQRVNLPSMGI